MSDINVAEISIELVKQFSKPVLDGAKSLGKDVIEKMKVNLNICFTKYLERAYDRYSKTKTLLYREAPVSLKNFYVRTDLMLGRKKVLKESEFIRTLQRDRRIVITGTAGSGKSTFCKSVFLDLVENPRGIFPIFVELRYLNNQKSKSLFEHVVEVMAGIDARFSSAQLDYSLKLGKVLLILDGFDEINGEQRGQYEKEIVSLSSNYHHILVLLSSRPDNRFSSWEEFFHYQVLPLDKEKAVNLVRRLDYDRQVKDSFLESLEARLFEKHESFASNPLLLTMMLLTYEQIADIPNKIHLFYEQAFLTLFNKHDSLKSLYKRKSFSGLPLDEFRKVFSTFCALSYADKKYSFGEGEIDRYLSKAIGICDVKASCDDLLNDLVDSVCMIQRDGLGFTFTHRSFQEYFTAIFLVGMTNKNKFEIFDKIAFVNDRDNVVAMVFDMRADLLEQEWIIPRLEGIVSRYSVIPNTKDGKLLALSMMYRGLVVHYQGRESVKETKDEPSIAYRLKGEDGDDASFFHMLYGLYEDDWRSHFGACHKAIAEKKRLSAREAELDLIRMDFSDDLIDLSDLNLLSKATKDRIIKSGCCDMVLWRIDFARNKLTDIKKKHREKQCDISNFLLGKLA